MDITSIDKENIYYPPGGLLIWMIMALEFLTFAIALLVFLHYRSNNLEAFTNAQMLINKTLGTANTIALVTSGLLMATTVDLLRSGRQKKALRFITFTIIFGLLFLTLKGVEYQDKIVHGYTFGYNDFFIFYWLLTGFHFIHVLVGIGILTYMAIRIKQGYYHRQHYADVETSAVFWHMCDLIWLFLFPVIYLIH